MMEFPRKEGQKIIRPISELDQLKAPVKKDVDTAKIAFDLAGIETTEKKFYTEKDEDWQGLPLRNESHYSSHNTDYAKHVGGKLSGKGMRHDPHHISHKVLNILSGHTQVERDLMHTYVHSRVPKARLRPFKHKPADVLAMHNESISHQGGNLRVKELTHPYILLV